MLEQITNAKRDAWALFVRLYPRLQAFTEPSIEVNNRLTSTAGRCFYTERKIDISSKLFAVDPAHILERTVPHEVAHQVAWDLFKSSGHCSIWKGVMVSAGLPPDTYHSIGATTEQEATAQESFYTGMRVSFQHTDRQRKVTEHTGIVTKVNPKTLSVIVDGMVWKVPKDYEGLKIC